MAAPSPSRPPDPPVTALPTAKDLDSDSDYEHYDFSSKPPVALSTFYSEHPTGTGIPATLPQDPRYPAQPGGSRG